MKKISFILIVIHFSFSIANSQSGWFLQISGTNYSLNATCLLNSNTGFVVGDNSIVLRTFNGGNSWNNLNVGPYGLWATYFLDASTGYIGGSGGGLWKTTNGGAS